VCLSQGGAGGTEGRVGRPVPRRRADLAAPAARPGRRYSCRGWCA